MPALHILHALAHHFEQLGVCDNVNGMKVAANLWPPQKEKTALFFGWI